MISLVVRWLDRGKDDMIESLYHALLNHNLVTRVFSVEMDLPGGTSYTK